MPSKKNDQQRQLIIAAIGVAVVLVGVYLVWDKSYLSTQVAGPANTTTLSATDRYIQSILNQIRELAVVYYKANNNSYVGFDSCEDGICTAGGKTFTGQAEVGTLIAEITTTAGAAPALNTSSGASQEFCISSRLYSSPYQYFCTDSTGSTTRGNTNTCGAVSTICPPSGTSPTPLPAGARSLWQNPRNRFDVNNDGYVTSNDLLRIGNSLNSKGPRDLVKTNEPPPPPFIDVNGDKFLTVIDAQALTTCLNKGGQNC